MVYLLTARTLDNILAPYLVTNWSCILISFYFNEQKDQQKKKIHIFFKFLFYKSWKITWHIFAPLITEEAVNEVKRQAVSELQKAVAAAESKATELVNSERSKMERTLIEERRRLREEVTNSTNHQEESGEVGKY